ncbi:MAG: CRP/FNR family transcriptional regulator [Saprospiraceae bacterium]
MKDEVYIFGRMERVNSEILKLLNSHFPEIAEITLQEEIAKVGQLMHFNAGEVIMNYGSYIKLVPLVVKGSIKVVREDADEGRELLLYYLNSGQTCSMSFSCCMMNKQSDIRTTAEDDTTIIAIPVKYADRWMSDFKSWRNFVMRSYDSRLQEMIKTIGNIAFKKMDERLITYLTEKSKAQNSTIINTTHQEIAHELNASREAISRLLKQLEKNDTVKLGRNKIELL